MRLTFSLALELSVISPPPAVPANRRHTCHRGESASSRLRCGNGMDRGPPRDDIGRPPFSWHDPPLNRPYGAGIRAGCGGRFVDIYGLFWECARRARLALALWPDRTMC